MSESKEINHACINVIYELHISLKDKKYKEFTEDVISDIFMGKIKNNKLIGITERVKNTIKYFYYFANKLSIDYTLKGCVYTVYRGISSNAYIIDNKIIQPIPFSVSILKENTDNWIGLNCCRLHIIFNSETKFICIDNTLEGKEIVLPAGVLNILEEWEENTEEKPQKIKNYKCVLDPTKTYDEMLELQKNYNYI